MFMKPVKVEHEDIKKAIRSGDSYIQVEDRTFLLFEVDQIKEPGVYEVIDPKEKKQLLQAIEGENPVLTEEEVNRMLEQ